MSTRILKVRNPELEDELQLIWDGIDGVVSTATPIDAVAALSTLSIVGDVTIGETIVIGADTYEFATSGAVTEGNIKVDVTSALTNTVAVTALIAASAGGTEPVAITDSTGGVAAVTATVLGVLANAIVTTTDVNTGFDVVHLTGGIDGTVGASGQLFYSATKLYVAVDTCTISDSNWKSVAIS